MRRPSDGHLFTAGSVALILLALGLAWVSGPFPVPWNDELVFTDIGQRFLHSGRLTESFWSMYDPRFGEGLVNTPPLYPIFVGLLQAATGGSLLAMRLVHGAILIGGLACWVRRREATMHPDGAKGFLPGLLLLLSLVANPYFLRAAFFIRPDGFILLAFLWLAGHIWAGTFLATRENALKAGAVMGLAGQTHFSALVLIPLFGLGLLLGLRREGRPILAAFRDAALMGCPLMTPYLAWFLPRVRDWWRLVQETQGTQKYSHLQTIGAYLWPPDFVVARLPAQRWAPAAWGPESTSYLWIIGLAVLPWVATRIALREQSSLRGFTFWVLGALGTWFYIRLPELWFATLSVASLQAMLSFHLWERFGPQRASLVCGGLALVHLLGLGLFLPQSGLPSWVEHRAAMNRIETLLERAAPEGPVHVYVSALPDPSVDLMARWPRLKITRGMDFPSYRATYTQKIMVEPQAWILGEPGVQPCGSEAPRAFLFDWGQTLAQAVQRGELDVYPIHWGGYRIWVALRRSGAPARPPQGQELRQKLGSQPEDVI